MPTYFDPYREDNERAPRRLKSLTRAEAVACLKEIGVLDKRGNLTKKYRTRPTPPFQVGDRVRFRLGAFDDVVAEVLEDRGPILSHGRRLILVTFTTREGGHGQVEIASNQVARLAAAGAKRGERRTSTKPVLSSVSSRRRGASVPRRAKEAKSAKPRAASSVARKRAAS